MRFDILTIFPNIFAGFISESLIGKAVKKGLIKINLVDIRSFTKDKHKTVDDKPFGGGPGMVIKIEPVYNALKSIKALTKSKSKEPLVVLLSPQGRTLDQDLVKDMAKHKRIVLICGHYEGIDERITNFVDFELSIGDFVLNGGEVAAMAVAESVARIVPGFVKEEDSIRQDSFYNNTLDWPCYTRPYDFMGYKVPEALLTGNHEKIKLWRLEQADKATKIKKPYLQRERN